MGASPQLLQSIIPDTQDNSLSFSVLNYLKRLKNQAKIEFEKLCADVINKANSNNQKVSTHYILCSISIHNILCGVNWVRPMSSSGQMWPDDDEYKYIKLQII